MPEIILVKSCSSAKGKIMLEHPCSALIAAIMCEWAHVEDVLANMFSASMGNHEWHKDGSVSVFPNWVAKITLQEINSIHGKLKVVDKSIKPFLSDVLNEEWLNIKKEISQCAEKRNNIAHSAWMYSLSYPECLIHKNSLGQNELYKISDFEEIFLKIFNLFSKIYLFQVSVLKAKTDGKIKFPKI